MAYRAEIEIGVRGQERLNRLQNQISQLANQITRLNDESIFDPVAPRAVQSIENYSNAVSVAAANLREAALGTREETNAVRQYVQAMGEANAARSRQNSLIAQEVANRRTVRPGDAGFGQQMPALPPAVVRQQTIQQSWQTFFRDAADLATDLQQTAAAKRVNLKSSWGRFFTDAAEVATGLNADTAAKRLSIQNSWKTFFAEAADVAVDLKTNSAAQRLNIQNSWKTFFDDAAEVAVSLKTDTAAKRLNIENSWNLFFQEAADLANDLTARIRSTEGASSAAARNRLAADAERRRRITNAGFGVQGPKQPLSSRGGGPGRLANVALGAGFPLLFGGGPGAVLGGAAGGGLVGGPAAFAAQIALSAIGQQLDIFTEALLNTGKALNDPIESFEELAQQGLFASKAQEKYIKKLIEAGKVNEAAAAIQEEIVKKIGAQGVKDLQAAGAAGDKFNRTMAELGIQVQAAVAGPLTEFLGFVNTLVSSVAAANRQQAELRDFGAALTAADPAAFRQYLKESTALAQKTGGVVDPTAVKQLQQKYITKYNLTPGAVTSEVDQTAAQQVTARTNELRNQVTLSEKQLALTGMTLEEDGRAYVQAAQAVALQEYDNKLLEIKNSQIGKIVDQQQIELQQKNAKLAYEIRLKQIDEEITQNAQVRARAQAQAYIQLSKEIQNTLEFKVREAEFTGGTEAALQKELELHKDITLQRAYVLGVERSIALEEAERTGTVETVNLLYDKMLKNLQDQRNLEEDILKTKIADLQTERAVADIRAEYQAREPFAQLRRELELQAQYGKTYLRLVTEGMLPAEAERIANFEKLVSDQLYAIDQQVLLTEAAIAEAEARGASAQKIKELREELERINKARGAVLDEAAKGPGQGPSNRQRLETAIADVKGELNELIDPVNQVVAAADAIGTAFADSFKGVVSGAMTAQEALASFFQSVADHFLNMAAQMIAKWIQLTILNSVLQLFPGGGGGGKGGFSGDSLAQFNASAAMYRANGGPVSAGSPYVVGEKGPELFVPGNSGTIVPNNALGGNKVEVGTINISIENTGEQLSPKAQKQLANQVQGIVMATLVNERRSGGVLR